jgi:squalene-hopene/tetraprenyl-beta-curcumene cyclase
VLSALAQAGITNQDEAVQRAVAWLQGRQNADGGWGESNQSYYPQARAATHVVASTPHQSAWALLALLAAGEVRSDSVLRGIDYLRRTQQIDGLWADPNFTAPGFPRVFYLKYHGYCAYFPLWALAAYRNLISVGTAH